MTEMELRKGSIICQFTNQIYTFKENLQNVHNKQHVNFQL